MTEVEVSVLSLSKDKLYEGLCSSTEEKGLTEKKLLQQIFKISTGVDRQCV